MPDTDVAVTSAADAPPIAQAVRSATTPPTEPLAEPPLPGPLPTWPRIAAIGVLTLVAYGASYARVVADAIAGSGAAYLVVVPVLAALIATGYRTAPRGVNDAEADWIIAAMFGIVGFTGIHLLSERMPTLVGLWQLPLLGVVLWLACAVAVLFGVRHVAQMWALWLFTLCAATPLPYLLTVAALGGSDIVAALTAAALGAAAVFLAGRAAPVGPRLITTAACFALASAVALAVGRLGMLLTVVVAAGVLPVIAVAALASADGSMKTVRAAGLRPGLTRKSGISLAVLAVVAGLLAVCSPHAGERAEVRAAAADWARRAGLATPTSYPFVTRYLGAGSTLVRYSLPSVPGLPDAAVDVMSTPHLSALDDFAEAVWYPTSKPINYRPAEPSSAMPLGTRIIHSDADATTDGVARDWYATTWMWRLEAVYQRVTVIVSQTVGESAPPPPPQPLSMFESGPKPTLWLARQQPDAHGPVDELVTARAADAVDLLVAAGAIDTRRSPVEMQASE
ncbi:hypothetical protein BH09ACT7_BH09ACT7_33120 [soil metagenome]